MLLPLTPPQLIVAFKPGADSQKKGKALGKSSAAEKRVLRKGGKDSGDVSLVTVKIAAGQSKRAQLRAADGSIQNGKKAIHYAYGEPLTARRKLRGVCMSSMLDYHTPHLSPPAPDGMAVWR